MRFLAIAAFAAIWFSYAPTQSSPLLDCVIDQAPKDPTFVQFRDNLLRMVRAHDARRFLALVDKNIFLEPEGAQGVKVLEDTYHPENPRSALWQELEFLLRRGGQFTENRFVAPFLGCDPSSGWGYNSVCIAGKNVPVYASPSASSAVLRRVSCARLRGEDSELSEPIQRAGWHAVAVTGRWGYVEQRYLRLDDKTLVFEKVNGKWRLVAFTEPE
jgi:hypothetical protein